MADTESGGRNAEAADLLYGFEAIASHLQMTPRQVQHLAHKDELPTFKIGKISCSTRSALADHFAAKIQRSGAGA